MLFFPTKQCEMNYLLPLFACDSLFDYILTFVYTHTNYPHSVSPDSLILLEHFLVVFHRLLARSTPSSPDIDEQYFPRSMSQLGLTLIENIIKQSIIFELSSQLLIGIQLGIYLKFFKSLIDRIELVLIDMLQLNLNRWFIHIDHNIFISRSFLDLSYSQLLYPSSLMCLEFFQYIQCFLQHQNVIYLLQVRSYKFRVLNFTIKK